MNKEKKIKMEYSYSGAVALAADANYDFDTALYELIDNAFAAKANNVTVTITTNPKHEVLSLSIEDDGTGLPSSEIGVAFAPGGKKGDGINEHGVGMKAAIMHFGKLDECRSSTGKETWYIHELDPDNNDGNIHVEMTDPEKDTGWLLQIDCRVPGKAIYTKNPTSTNPTQDSYKWGRKYADILGKASKKLTVVYLDEKSKQKKSLTIKPWRADFESILQNEVPIVGVNNDFKARLTIYKLREKSINRYHPVKATTGSAGFDIVMHDRCVVERSKAPLKEVKKSSGTPINFSHPSYNRLYGRLIVEKGIKTTPKKDNIQENDPAFKELQELVADVWNDNNLQRYFKDDGSDEASEEDIEINLMEMLDERDYENIERQQRISHGFRTDVQADKDGEHCIWEVKKDQAFPNDILQLVNYMRITKTTKGVLLADGFHGDCADYLKMWGVNVEFWDLSKITYRALKESGSV